MVNTVMWNEEKILPSFRLHWFKMHHWQYHHHSKYCTLVRWQALSANAELIREGFFFFFFLSVPPNSSIPLKQWIRKIKKNSLKLPLLFFNIQYFYWGFQTEFIHMSDVWDWTNLILKSYVFFITLLPVSECFNWYVVRFYWMISDQSSSNL